MARVHWQRTRMRNVVEVNVAIAAIQWVDARQHRSYFALRLVLFLLGCHKFQGIEPIRKMRRSVLHKPDMRLVNERSSADFRES